LREKNLNKDEKNMNISELVLLYITKNFIKIKKALLRVCPSSPSRGQSFIYLNFKNKKISQIDKKIKNI